MSLHSPMPLTGDATMMPTWLPPRPPSMVDDERPYDLPGVQARFAFRRLLESLPERLRLPGRAIDALVGQCRITHLRAGRSLILPDRGLDSVHVIVSGAVRVTSGSSSSRRMLVRIVPPGWILGPTSSSSSRWRTFGFKTHVSSAVASLPWPHAAAALTGLPADRVVGVAGAALRVLAEVILQKCQLLTMSLRDRLLCEVRVLAHDFGRETADGVLIDLRITQGDLAKLVAAGRSSVCRTLRLLRDEGLVGYEDGYLVLRKICDGDPGGLPSAHAKG